MHAVYQESDIPSTLGADNIAYIKRAMIGHINRPSVVYVSVIAAAAEIAKGFNALATTSAGRRTSRRRTRPRSRRW